MCKLEDKPILDGKQHTKRCWFHRGNVSVKPRSEFPSRGQCDGTNKFFAPKIVKAKIWGFEWDIGGLNFKLIWKYCHVYIINVYIC